LRNYVKWCLRETPVRWWSKSRFWVLVPLSRASLIRLGSRNVGETEEYIRLSYVGSEETINEGLRRIKKAIEGKGS